MHVHEFVLARHGFRFFWQSCACVYARACVCTCRSESASFSLPPQGPEVTTVRKQIDFSPPTHKQLTTQRSIRHTLETLSDKPSP